ncbi:MAG: hypothetical protein ACKVOJ_07595 [Sphingomonadaceae bacterium]
MRIRSLLAGIAIVVAIPAIGQDVPKSILPPGFGEPDAPPEKAVKPPKPPTESSTEPSDLVPNISLNTPDKPLTGGAKASTKPGSDTELVANEGEPGDESGATTRIAAPLQDLPPHLRRSTSQVGVLSAGDGDMGPTAFAGVDGRFLMRVMRKTHAPIASRWLSIVLRRGLLSRAVTPTGVNGSDWAAERAWLLLRMGEAENARMLVQAVDIDQYSPKMFDVAMQAALATSDPAALCPMVDPALSLGRKEPAWLMARAMCAGLSGESAQAAALIDVARSKTKRRGIDALLAEKVIGAGGNTRRAVNIQWDDVPRLTAWRYGLASATALEIPPRLMGSVGPQVSAWQARSPLLSATQRFRDADIAASLGVLSSAALVDHYAAVADETDPVAQAGKPATLLRIAYVAKDAPARISAMRQLWAGEGVEDRVKYARMIVTARAAAVINPSAAFGTDVDMVLASMLSAGLDTFADRWADVASVASGEAAVRARGLLAVGGTRPLAGFGSGEVRSYISQAGGENGLRGRMLFAALAGLGRLSESDISSMAESVDVPVGRVTNWTRALNQSVAARAPAAVAVLCGAGMQSLSWRDVPPVQLYHIVSALRRVGYEAEARMIAAEALMRT